jgi:uncharacterized protein involved in exopolysaccharide biosynthesis
LTPALLTGPGQQQKERMEKNIETPNSLLPYLTVLLRKKWFLIANFTLICILGWGYVFFVVKPQYMTSITFFPPAESSSILNVIPGLNLGGSIAGSDIVPEQIVTIFQSQALRRQLIERFNLFDKFKLTGKPFRYKAAMKILEKDLEIQTNEVGNLGITKLVSFTINAYHTSPDTSMAMINAMFGMVDSVIRTVSTGAGRNNRLFVEKQLAASKSALDSLQRVFKAFQVKFKAYDIPEQVGVSLKSYGEVKALQITNQVRLARLTADYSPDHPDVIALQKSNSALQAQLDALEKKTTPDVMVGLDLSTDLIPTFTNLYRDMEVQHQIILFLTQELEQSKIKEARDVTQIVPIDPAFKPLYKTRPKRMFLLAGIIGGYMFFLVILIILQHFYTVYFKNTHAYHEILSALRHR